ncbi:MAG: DNA polymerase II large subunit, partial [Methanosarcinaceae archaeon]|nr:DNA polymerase II large subunit [Methanosarcinaceae archaeon]
IKNQRFFHTPIHSECAAKNDINNFWDNSDIDVMQMVNKLSGIVIKKRAPVRIGTRMGRPGKSDKRKMNPSTHVLFPIANTGGIERKIKNAADFKTTVNSKLGKISVDIGIRTCPSCNIDTHELRCDCGEFTLPKLFCPKCDAKKIDNKELCPKCNTKTISVRRQDIDFRKIYHDAMEQMSERDLPNFKGIKKLSSKHRTPEPFEKGIFRAKYDLYTFKDGTIRYDMSDVPLTHIRPNEIGVSVEKMKELGYLEDIYGTPLTDRNQVLCLKVQDIVISKDAAEYLLKISKFIDDLLVKYYKMDSYYNAKTIGDMVGILIMGLAPHTSAGILGRVIGYIKSSVCYAHPFFHAAKRRNCDGDEDSIILLLDGLLNFSFDYLPDKRGGKMDAPLVLTSHIEPSEVDGEAHNVDVCEQYPLEFYEATEKFTNPKDLEDKIDLIGNRLDTPLQYTKFMFTHDTTDIASGPIDSTYKTIDGMENKMNAQLSLGKKIRAVDESDVAERVLTSHFLPDMIGNLRAFSRQGTRCIKCGKKYRRPPLKGNCIRCGGNVILTVHEGSVKKYLKVSTKVANEYEVSEYTRQRIELLGYEIKALFESDKSKQMGLGDFM